MAVAFGDARSRDRDLLFVESLQTTNPDIPEPDRLRMILQTEGLLGGM